MQSNHMKLTIREATAADFDAVWHIFHEVVKRGDTYAFDVDTTREQAQEIWFTVPQKTFVVEANGEVVGSYYLMRNQAGNGSHVCNCGYMVAAQARGGGLATRMCQHSQETATALGYRAMQFNSVVSTNEGAVRLWHKLGFDTVGVLPKAFHHPHKGYVDVLVMYKWLAP